ncbi:hypothetical protein JS561_05750 [Salmonella enterica subsp. enterica serovar Infantis]|nr:hypothetical protein JS561_05750 [Salmonella enterica subsp. enterica serovar Infantis]
MALKNIQRHHTFISSGTTRRAAIGLISAGYRLFLLPDGDVNALSCLQNFGYLP